MACLWFFWCDYNVFETHQVSLMSGYQEQGFQILFYELSLAFKTNYCGFKIKILNLSVRKEVF